MDKAIRKLQKELKWPLEICKTDGDLFEASCDPEGKKHIFFLPEGENRNNSQFIRCLCLAFLAERVHPLFSAIVVEGPEAMPESVFENQIWPIFCVSRLWFADALMKDRCPEESRKEMEKKLDLIGRSFPEGRIRAGLSHTLQVALTIAEAKYFWQIDRKPQGTIEEMTRIFLQIDPYRPDLDALEGLNHNLLKKYSSFSAELVHNQDIGERTWKVF